MGSLMGGWDSHVSDPNQVKYMRNKSLTKEDIETFWKSKKHIEDEHLRDISLLSPRSQKIIFEEASNESPVPTTGKKNAWWMRSNSAFLNEPPVIAQEGTARKYTAQFHVPDKTGSTGPHGGAGISA